MVSAEQLIEDNGYEDVVVFKDFSYDSALQYITTDNRAVYDYDLMVKWLMETQEWTEEESVEWIDYNTIRALGYAGENGPIVVHKLINFEEELKSGNNEQKEGVENS